MKKLHERTEALVMNKSHKRIASSIIQSRAAISSAVAARRTLYLLNRLTWHARMTADGHPFALRGDKK